MKLATSQNADKQNAPQQMKSEAAAGKSMSPPPFSPEASTLQPTQMKAKEEEKEDKLATAQLKSEEDEKESAE